MGSRRSNTERIINLRDCKMMTHWCNQDLYAHTHIYSNKVNKKKMNKKKTTLARIHLYYTERSENSHNIEHEHLLLQMKLEMLVIATIEDKTVTELCCNPSGNSS